MSLAQETPRSLLFGPLFQWDPNLGTTNKMMCSKAVPGGLLPQECNMRSGCGYPQSLNQAELEEAMDKTATFQEAHSSGKGGDESVHAVMWHSIAITMHAQQGYSHVPHQSLFIWQNGS
jgi:hypothetical protein